jgi:predicted nuclease of restriction endonuclease-like (RecB) superfamily
LPWGHVETLLDRLSTRDERDWYASRAIAEGWNRNVLAHFIKVDLRRQVGSAPTNFAVALDAPDSDLARELVKDPYVFEHLVYADRVDERTVEQALMDRLQDTLMEFGKPRYIESIRSRTLALDQTNGRCRSGKPMRPELMSSVSR